MSREITWKINTNGCWICDNHYIGRNGYPKKRVKEKVKKISHIMYERFNGEGSIGNMWVLHSCDNPNCINPNHLSLGTPQDNTDQMMERGRWGGSEGEKVHTAKLNCEQVKAIRQDNRPSRELGLLYNVTKTTILRIKNRTSWKGVL